MKTYISNHGYRIRRRRVIQTQVAHRPHTVETFLHGLIDGFSRRIIYLRCNDNNPEEAVLDLFLEAMKGMETCDHHGQEYNRVENILVCEAIANSKGELKGSLIAGPSTHNQRNNMEGPI